ncbi:hypothetical protein [Chitinophaga sp. RAB17]|uniref:hypothetical protein n=1 Tax=Chitinophaga sp. RAB17 TaxID=3233049 RepID=UPI003F915614
MKKSIFYLPGLLILSLTAKSQIQNQATVAQPASFWINGIGNMRSSATYSPVGQAHLVLYNDSLVIGKRRWALGLTNAATATPNSGADFALWNYDDAGTFIGTAFSVARASGLVNAPKGFSTPLINSNNSAGAISILGGATGVDSYRGAEIGLRGGTYTTTPGEMSFHTGIGGSGASQPERMRIDANGLVTMGYGLRLNNPTSNNISFDPIGLGAPTFTSRSPGTRITLHPALGAASGDYAMGIESQHMWFSINVRNNINGFKFYAGTDQIGRIDGVGNNQWEGQGRFKGWLTGTAAAGPAAEIGVANGVASIIGFDRTPGVAKYIPLALSGGTTSSNQTSVTINEVGMGIGTTTFFGKFSLYDPSNNKASITMQSGGDSRFWINEGDNLLKIGATGGSTPPALGVINITNTGNVGIGTTSPQSEFSVKGTITAQRVKVTQTGWADYVFHKDYHLPTLPEVEKYVATHQHLEGIPSAAEVEKDGIDVGDMNKKLLAKVEELTLYLIEQNKKIAALEEWKMQQEKSKK